MKRLTLEEGQNFPALSQALGREEIILEREGQPIAAIIPIAEYEKFCAWRQSQEREQRWQKKHAAFEREREAYERLKPELLHTHRGRCVAILNGQVVEVGDDKAEVLDRVYKRFGYVPVYVQRVEEHPRVYKMPYRKVVGNVEI